MLAGCLGTRIVRLESFGGAGVMSLPVLIVLPEGEDALKNIGEVVKHPSCEGRTTEG